MLYGRKRTYLLKHFDHSKNRTVKCINLLNCVYLAQGTTLPVAYELITKPVVYRDEKTDTLEAQEHAVPRMNTCVACSPCANAISWPIATCW